MELKLNPEVKKIAQTSESDWAREVETHFHLLMKAADFYPDDMELQYPSSERLTEWLLAAPDADTRSRVLWRTTSNLALVYLVTSLWRGAELASATMRNLRKNALGSATVCVRALYELAASNAITIATYHDSFVANFETQSSVQNEFNVVIAGGTADPAAVEAAIHATGMGCVLQLRQVLEKGFYSTRIKDLLTELPRQQSILKSFEKPIKQGGSPDHKVLYGYLSEITHPNHLGFARFVEPDWAANRMRLHRKKTSSGIGVTLTECILSALAWSCFQLADGNRKVSETTVAIAQRWPNQASHTAER